MKVNFFYKVRKTEKLLCILLKETTKFDYKLTTRLQVNAKRKRDYKKNSTKNLKCFEK